MNYEIGDFVSAKNKWGVIIGKYENSPQFYWVSYLSVLNDSSEILGDFQISPLPGKFDLSKPYFQNLLGWAKNKHPNLDIKFIQKEKE